METNNEHTNEDQINIIEILFTILSQRFLIISSLIIFIFLGMPRKINIIKDEIIRNLCDKIVNNISIIFI